MTEKKFPPKVGTTLTEDEIEIWCLGKAYFSLSIGNYLLLFCPSSDLVKVCLFKHEKEMFEKVGENTLCATEMRTIIGSLVWIIDNIREVIQEKRNKLRG